MRGFTHLWPLHFPREAALLPRCPTERLELTQGEESAGKGHVACFPRESARTRRLWATNPSLRQWNKDGGPQGWGHGYTPRLLPVPDAVQILEPDRRALRICGVLSSPGLSPCHPQRHLDSSPPGSFPPGLRLILCLLLFPGAAFWVCLRPFLRKPFLPSLSSSLSVFPSADLFSRQFHTQLHSFVCWYFF